MWTTFHPIRVREVSAHTLVARHNWDLEKGYVFLWRVVMVLEAETGVSFLSGFRFFGGCFCFRA